MVRKLAVFAVVFCFIALASTAFAQCTPTGFQKDGINLTAAVINPTGVVSGTIATTCNIGVYYDRGKGTVQGADISGANYFGVLVNGDVNIVKVDVINNKIHDIGEKPLNGTQHGVGIYFSGRGTGTAKGRIAENTVSKYQKGGIVANGLGVTVNISENEVVGEGAVDYIAQNGIQVGRGASAQVMDNTVTGNSYSGINGASSGGILVVGGGCYGSALTVGTQIVGNTLTGNDVGVFVSNLDVGELGCAAPTTATNVKVVNNIISNAAVTNVSGLGSCGYQAGVSDVGNNDKIINNNVSGEGYATYTDACPPAYTIAIDADTSFTNRPKVHANDFQL
jgi:hypothetical protein